MMVMHFYKPLHLALLFLVYYSLLWDGSDAWRASHLLKSQKPIPSTSFLHNRQVKTRHSTLAAFALFNHQKHQSPCNKNQLEFGNKFDIRVRLPTRDPLLAESFLQDPAVIITETYDSTQSSQLSSTLWRIRFADINIPGIDNISPVIDIDFQYFANNGSIIMECKQWTLNSGKQGILNRGLLGDASFLKTFKLQLKGMLTLEYPQRRLPAQQHSSSSSENSSNTEHQQQHQQHHNHAQPNTQLVSAVGYVDFRVEAQKPAILTHAPAFVIDSAINLVQGLVADFVKRKFAAKLLSAFQSYAVKYNQQQQVQQQQQQLSRKIPEVAPSS